MGGFKEFRVLLSPALIVDGSLLLQLSRRIASVTQGCSLRAVSMFLLVSVYLALCVGGVRKAASRQVRVQYRRTAV